MAAYTVDFEPLGLRAQGEEGATVLDIARDAGIGLVSVCGGEGRCRRCLVRVVEGRVSEPTPSERDFLDGGQLRDGLRLACFARVLSDLKVDVPVESRQVAQRLVITGAEVDVPFDPPVTEHLPDIVAPTVAAPSADASALVAALCRRGCDGVASVDLEAARRLPGLLQKTGGQVRASVRGAEVVDVRPPEQGPLGLAIDVGTTKVAATLVDMETGRIVDVGGITNPQIAYGEDVMSRLSYATLHGGDTLKCCLIDGLNQLIARLCAEPERIVEVVMVGNTAMHHLALGLPVRRLGLAPYTAVVSDAMDVKARDVGLLVARGAYLHALPNVAGFVGADHVAMILATQIDLGRTTRLGIDIGTNTEVVLAHRGKLYSCSTASGPAFEGAHIRNGLRAVSGTIERVRLDADGRPSVSTVDDASAIGVCGSGVLDSVAELLHRGLLNRRGRLSDGPSIRSRDDERELVLVTAANSGATHDITVTEHDIGEVMLAKAAIRTGIDALLDEAGCGVDDLAEVVVAGAFGLHIDTISAIRIGLLPPVAPEHVAQVGNAAAVGARLALISREQRRRARELATRVRYVELMTRPDFAPRFARNMYLEEVPTATATPIDS